MAYTARSVTKQTLARNVSDLLELPYGCRYGTAYAVVTKMLAVMAEALRRGETVKIAGFGTLYVRTRKPTRSLQYFFPYLKKKGLYWEIADLPEKKYVVFRPSKTILRVLNKGEGNKDEQSQPLL